MEHCCYDLDDAGKKSKKQSEERALQEFGEEDFVAEVKRCVARILGVKKTEGAGDRMVRFLGLFLKTSTERDIALFSGEDGGDETTQALQETPTSRLTFAILSMLIPLLSAKEKTVRYRATQIITHVVNTLESIDDELYHLIRQSLIKRIRDKEPTIRIQAVMGLGRLAGNEAENDEEDEDDDDVESAGLLGRLLDALQNDTSAEVRRSLLLNLPLTPATLPYLLERARDLDGPTRRALYARLLPTLGDFRHLSLSMREKLLRWGLRDRDENVRKAAGRLFSERWIEDCAGTRAENQDGSATQQQVAPPSIPALLELLERIDVVNSGVDDGIALEAMKCFWESRPDYLDAVNFNDEFWSTLGPEAAFVARSFNDFCQSDDKYQALVEEKMPEVTRLGFYLQKHINNLLDTIKKFAEEGTEEDTVELEFVVEQLLHMAQTLDYTDEIGRRKMFSLLREALAMAELPDEVTRLSVEVLRLVCGLDAAGEKEFCGVVLEAIAEVHDNIVPEAAEEDESFVSAKSEVSDNTGSQRSKKSSALSDDGEDSPEQAEKAIREIMINMKCLHIAQCMLQNVDGNLQQNISLVTMLNNLVVPAVRSHEAPIRERGLVCLGLCCLLDRTLAEENITLFVHCFGKGHEALQVTSLQILSDLLVTHPTLLSPLEPQGVDDSATSQPPAYQKPLLKAFTRALKPTSSAPAVQASAASSLSKLLLTSRLMVPSASIDDLLRTLVSSFFSPATADNPALRQSLAYFLPVYCHSRLENCQRMARVAVGVVHTVMNAADEYYTLEAEEDSDGDVDETVAEKQVKTLMGTVVGMLSEWTDGRQLVNLSANTTETKAPTEGENAHLGVAIDALERALSNGCHSAERKYLLNLLAKLYIPLPPSTASSSNTSSVTPPPTSYGGGAMLTSEETQQQALFALHAEQLELATTLKSLLDEAISDDLAKDAAGRNTLVKVKNSVLKLVKPPESSNSAATSATKSARQSLAPTTTATGSGRRISVASALLMSPRKARSSGGSGSSSVRQSSVVAPQSPAEEEADAEVEGEGEVGEETKLRGGAGGGVSEEATTTMMGDEDEDEEMEL